MFKKNSWIVALLLAMTIMFIGCLDAPEIEEIDGVETELFDLADYLTKAQKIATQEEFETVFEGAPVQAAGNIGSVITFDIKKEKGAFVMQVNATGASWGPGFDLRHNIPGRDSINFKAGDEIFIKGRVISGDNLFLNINPGAGVNKAGGWEHKGNTAFEETIKLTQADVNSISASSPQCIRIRANGESVFVIEQLIITGFRPEGYAPDIDEPTEPEPKDIGYVVPDAGVAHAFFLNLNEFPGELEDDDFEFNVGTQTLSFELGADGAFVLIPLTDAQRDIVAYAFDNGRTVVATVDGTSTGGNLRIGFRHATQGSDWAGALLDDQTFSGSKDFTLSKHAQYDLPDRGANNVGTFMIQARGGARDVTLKSIKITSHPIDPVSLTDLDSFLDAPVVGNNPQFEIESAQFTGVVSWSPAIGAPGDWAGLFYADIEYTAFVTLTAKPFFTFDTMYKNFTYDGAIVAFNPLTSVVTVPFAVTDDLSLIPAAAVVSVQVSGANVTTPQTTYTTLSVGYVPDGAPASLDNYRWQRLVTGVWTDVASTATYTPNTAGSYRVIGGAAGYLGKSSAAITVNNKTIAGTIIATPVNTPALTFEVLTATGTAAAEVTADTTPTYQWLKDGAAIATGGTSATYLPTEAGSYSVRIGGTGYDAKTSTGVAVIVNTGFEDDAEFGAEAAGSPITLTVEGVGGQVIGFPNGFLFNSTAGYGGGFAMIAVDLEGGELSDFATLKFTYKGITGDVGWKTINVRAFTADPSDTVPLRDPTNDNCIARQNYSNNGLADIAFSQSIDAAKIITTQGTHPEHGDAPDVMGTSDSSLIWFAINLHSGAATFMITDIELLP